MQIVVKAGDSARKILEAKSLSPGIAIHWLEDGAPIPEAAAYFDLCFEDGGINAFAGIQTAPVFVNAVIADGRRFPENTLRINAWPGFLENEKTEITATNEKTLAEGVRILDALQWKYQAVPDTIGMIAPRVIAMIVNEAYFALGEQISTKEEIDIAMKLGTNYPFGPFEWSEKIGLKKICTLLQQLGEQNTRYTIAPLLEEEAQSTNQPIN